MAARLCLLLALFTSLSLCDLPGRGCDQPVSHHHCQRGHLTNVIGTTLGDVQGLTERVQVKDGRYVEVDVFWGIPYAEKPVGDLRFRPPVPIYPWDGVYQATTPPNSCMQVLSDGPFYIPNPTTPVSEDCLYLNIWRPRCHGQETLHCHNDECDVHNMVQDKGLSTLVWIYGGGYTTGSTTISLYNDAVLAATECLIVASMNYRLGALGFIFLDVLEAPGNMGLLDMTLALTWIKDNVENFGGNKDSMTVFGNSAGGASSSLFLLSPLTQNLFSRAIIQSGSPVSHLAQQSRESALETAFEFSRKFSCFSINNTQIVECLKQVDAFSLTQEHFILTSDYRHFMTAVEDDYFLRQQPPAALRSGAFKLCNILLGATKDEGTYFMGLKWPKDYSFMQENTMPISEKELDDKLAEFFSDFMEEEHISQIVADVKVVYDLDRLRKEVDDPSLTLLDYVIGDVINTCPIRLIATTYAEASQQVFLYSFNHHHDRARLPPWVGAMHGFEIPFVFGSASVDSEEFSPREADLSQTIMTLWANFAKFGHPTPDYLDGPIWPTYNPPDPGNILVFTESAGVQVGQTETRRCAYWNSLPQSYLKSKT